MAKNIDIILTFIKSNFLFREYLYDIDMQKVNEFTFQNITFYKKVPSSGWPLLQILSTKSRNMWKQKKDVEMWKICGNFRKIV